MLLNFIMFFRNINEESIKLFDTNGRLIDKTKKAEFKKKLMKDLDIQEQHYMLFIENKMNNVQLSQQITLKEKEMKKIEEEKKLIEEQRKVQEHALRVKEQEIEKLKREDPTNKLIPILLEQMKAERESNNQRMEMTLRAMDDQYKRTQNSIAEQNRILQAQIAENARKQQEAIEENNRRMQAAMEKNRDDDDDGPCTIL